MFLFVFVFVLHATHSGVTGRNPAASLYLMMKEKTKENLFLFHEFLSVHTDPNTLPTLSRDTL